MSVHNGHARRKKHVVELCCFVAHAQHNASKEKRSGRKQIAHIAGFNVTENQQDGKTEKTAVGTWRQRVGKVVRARARRAKRTACRLEGNQEQAREETTAGR